MHCLLNYRPFNQSILDVYVQQCVQFWDIQKEIEDIEAICSYEYLSCSVFVF
jgi:hypothetical protein